MGLRHLDFGADPGRHLANAGNFGEWGQHSSDPKEDPPRRVSRIDQYGPEALKYSGVFVLFGIL